MIDDDSSPGPQLPDKDCEAEKDVHKSDPPIAQTGLALSDVEKQLEDVIRDLPEPKRVEVRNTFLQVFMAFAQRGGTVGPTIDPETAKILTDSADKEHEYRYKFLTQKQKDEAEESKRDDTFRTLKFSSRYKIVRPCSLAGLVVIPVCLFLGIYLAATGHETLGSSILTGVTTSFLSFIAGLSTGNLIRDKDE
jgi:hypothetical protein